MPSNAAKTFESVACCADIYRHPVVKQVLGESWHPGGLALTRKLAKELALTKDDRVLDVACGRGATSLMLGQVYKCKVDGIDTDAESLRIANEDATRYRLTKRVTFHEADAERETFAEGSFTVALSECAGSLFSQRQEAFGQVRRALAPGGRFLFTDVTFKPKELPPALDFSLANALCIPLGMGSDDYANAVEAAGFTVERRVDCSYAIGDLLKRADAFFRFEALASLFGAESKEAVRQAHEALESAKSLLTSGDLGYWAFYSVKK